MKFSIAFILVASATAWAADPVAMNVKTGQWEVTVTMNQNGAAPARPMPTIPPEQLARIPAEQRAKIEAAMAMASGAKPMVTKSCVKPEDLTRFRMNQATQNEEKNCTTTLVSSSPTKQVMQQECNFGDGKRMSTITVEAQSPELIKFNVISRANGSSKDANVNVNISGTSKWLGPVCTDAK